MPYSEQYMNSRQKFVLGMLAIVASAAVFSLVLILGFNEAAHNRHKEERIWQKCLGQNQPVLSCRAAIKGVG